jgi:hypothetical protein
VCGKDAEDIQEHMQDNHEEEEIRQALASMQPQVTPSVQVSRSQQFRKDYSTRIGISFSKFDFRLDVFNERREHPAGPFTPPFIEYISESQIIITPSATKLLLLELEETVKRFESEFGEIELDDGERRQF